MTQTQKNVRHPGEVIREELEARGWLQRDLAFVLGIPEQAVNLIVSGKRGISPDMAKQFGDAFDVPAEFFMNLQRTYDLFRAPQPNPDVSRRARLQEHFPVREMHKRGWLTEDDGALLEIQLARFFRVASKDDIPHLRHAAKKTHYDETPAVQLAWLFRVKQIAESVIAKPYSEQALRAAVARLDRLLYAPEETRHVPRILAECGVRYVVVEKLPGAKIDGVCFWLDSKSPVIGVSLQKDQIDNFWFVTRHEIEHVLRKDGQQIECLDEDLGEDQTGIPAQEKAANTAAAEFCVPQHKLTDFMARVHPYYSEQRILLFAQNLNLHPGIVIGQLQRHLKRYDLLKRYQAKVRQFVVPSATSDGWGLTYPVEL